MKWGKISINLFLLLFALFFMNACSGSGGSSSQAASSSDVPADVGAVPGNSQVTISWVAVSGASSYNLYWSTTPGVTPSSGTSIDGATSPYIQTGLANGTTYYYVVTALVSGVESAASDQVSATPSALLPPAAPTGVAATPGNGAATISWTAVSGAVSYNIYWSVSSGVTPSTGTKIAGVTNPYTQTGLTNGTTYYFVVTAVNGNGESTASSQVSCTPSLQGAPSGVTAVPGDSQVTISWTAVSGALFYNLYWSTSSGVTPSTGTEIMHANSPYTQTGLTNGTTYYYVVTAYVSGVTTPASAQVSATPAAAAPPTTPPISFDLPDPLGTVAQCGYFSYQAGAPSGGAGSPYTFNYGTGSLPPLGIFVNAGGLIAGTDVSPAGTYDFDVCVTDAAFTEECEPTSITVTEPDMPGTPSMPVPADGATGVSTSPTLSWLATSGTDSYIVYFGTSTVPPEVATVTTASFTPTGVLTEDTTYYWQIVSTKTCGLLSLLTTTGPLWSFTTSVPGQATISVTSSVCTIGGILPPGCVGDTGYCQETVTFTGTACGPVGAFFQFNYYISTSSLTGWTPTSVQGQYTRGNNDPQCASFTHDIDGSEASGNSDSIDATGDIVLTPESGGTPIIPSLTTSCTVCTCP